MFNKEEKDFLLNLMKQITINPSAPDVLKTVEIVQSVIKRLTENDEENS